MDCLKCKYEVLLFEKLGNDWDMACEGRYNWSNRNGSYETYRETLSNGTQVTTVARHDTTTWGPKYSDDEYEQGSEFECFVVLKFEGPDGKLYFRKNGTADSYGRVSWNGLFQEVKAVTKEVTVFENKYEVV